MSSDLIGWLQQKEGVLRCVCACEMVTICRVKKNSGCCQDEYLSGFLVQTIDQQELQKDSHQTPEAYKVYNP